MRPLKWHDAYECHKYSAISLVYMNSVLWAIIFLDLINVYVLWRPGNQVLFDKSKVNGIVQEYSQYDYDDDDSDHHDYDNSRADLALGDQRCRRICTKLEIIKLYSCTRYDYMYI